MQRAYAETANAPAFVDRVIYDPAASDACSLIGKLLEHGLRSGTGVRAVAVTVLSAEPLGKLIGADAATWLDRELVAPEPTPLRDAGFG